MNNKRTTTTWPPTGSRWPAALHKPRQRAIYARLLFGAAAAFAFTVSHGRFGRSTSGWSRVLDAIVMVRLADGSERLVVQAGQCQRFFHFLGELLQRIQVVGRGRHFGLRRLQKLLIPAIDQLRNFAADHVSGIRENFRAVVVRLLDRRRALVLLQEHARLRARSFDQVKIMISQPLDCFFVGSLFDFRCHFMNSILVAASLDAPRFRWNQNYSRRI